jgi:hypothetical protein
VYVVSSVRDMRLVIVIMLFVAVQVDVSDNMVLPSAQILVSITD